MGIGLTRQLHTSHLTFILSVQSNTNSFSQDGPYKITGMEISIFTDKSRVPANDDLVTSLGNTFSYWMALKDFAYEKYPKAIEEWNYPGAKYGWSFRIKDKKRAIIYFLPREKYFLVAFVFGQKATELVLQSDVSNEIKTGLESAKAYAEGRGIRIAVKDEKNLSDIKRLIEIKVSN